CAALAGVLGPAAPILDRNGSPAPVGQWGSGVDAQDLQRVHLLRSDYAPVNPIIAQIEGELELLATCKGLGHNGSVDVERTKEGAADAGGHFLTGLLIGDQSTVGQGEHG